MDSTIGQTQGDAVHMSPSQPSPTQGLGGVVVVGGGGGTATGSGTSASTNNNNSSSSNGGNKNNNNNNNNNAGGGGVGGGAATAISSIVAACKLQKPSSYSSPPPIANSPENNVCKLIEYRGAKVAAFVVNGAELICLPQAFDLFLKHLVGGLHTVYTKLKRLDIVPVVCNVEQVRILRGLGAIQPGVNRCKLLSCKEFDILYEDCTNSSARPGRPPKRSPSIHASPETLEKLKKSRLDGGEYQYDPRLYGKEYERILADEFKLFGYQASITGDRKNLLNGYPHHPYAFGALPYMPLNHPMMTPPVSMAMANHLGLRPDGSMIKDRSSSESDVLSPRSSEDRLDGAPKGAERALLSQQLGDKHYLVGSQMDTGHKPLNLHINGHARDFSKSNTKREDEEEDNDDDKESDDDKDEDLDDSADASDSMPNGDSMEKSSAQGHHYTSQVLNGESQGVSSIETLLLNIQGLLKVAAENARHHERQINFEKAELKIELLRERELRDSIEKQLLDEQRNRVMLQKRLKKEKKARRKIQEQMDIIEQNRVVLLSSEHLSTPPGESLLTTNDIHSPETGRERSYSETERKLQESQERSSHLYETYMTHSSSPGATRFPYHSLVKSDVQ